MKILTVLFALLIIGACSQDKNETRTSVDIPESITLSKDQLLDRIKGGWAGQTIGVTYGGPTEFRFNGTIIQDYQPIKWYDGYIKETMEKNPGLFDDIYMDLTFVDVFEKHGLDAPVEAFALAYAHAEYMLWHANQAGRYNILHGIMPPQSGHWLNNPHADCIDYQIESDFAGLMSPGMPNSASQISDKVGHIMNYGDGWYGGVYVGAMYALAFVSSDIKFVVKEALATIPSQSRFYQVISDVIRWYEENPDDWKMTWFKIQQKYSEDIGCPEGVFAAFNIDATVNAAYVVLGLLYGDADFGKTLSISTRAGQDSDCNPSTAGGILGTMIGYSKIPDYWKMGLAEAESIPFKYTTISLNDVYDMGFRHAVQNITRNGGSINGDQITIRIQRPVSVKFEQSFEGHFPKEKLDVHANLDHEYSFEFEGIGFVVRGQVNQSKNSPPYTAKAELYIDGERYETVDLPGDFTTRRYELFWKYQLTNKKHTATIRLLNSEKDHFVRITDIIIYTDRPNDYAL